MKYRFLKAKYICKHSPMLNFGGGMRDPDNSPVATGKPNLHWQWQWQSSNRKPSGDHDITFQNHESCSYAPSYVVSANDLSPEENGIP